MQKILLIVLILILRLHTLAFGQESEYQIKALFLEQFTRFIEWPESSGVSDTMAPFNVAVIGENPFGSLLEKTYAVQRIKNKRVKIHYYSDPEEINDCHILFISNSNKDRLTHILSYTRNKPILTVSDTEGFAQKDVLINFYLSGGKIKFEINEKAVHKSGLVMSYILLNLAEIVNPVKGQIK